MMFRGLVPIAASIFYHHLSTVSRILLSTSETVNGLDMTLSMPASRANSTYSCRTFAVVAITGKRRVSRPSRSSSRMRLVQANPFILGISQSIKMTSILGR